MRRISILLSITILLVAALLSAQCMKPATQGFMPVVAETPGGGGSYWQSDVILTDVSTLTTRAPNDVELWVAVYSTSVLRSKSRTITLSVGQTLLISQILSWISPDIPINSGQIYVLHFQSQYPIIASGRLYNTNTSDRADEVAGFGQGLPFLAYGAGMGPGESQYYPVPLDPNVARINVGLLNTVWTEATVMVSLWDDMGNLLAKRAVLRSEEYTVRGQEVIQFQINHPAVLDLTGYAPGYILIEVMDGLAGAVYSYVSVVDNVRVDGGDPTSDPYLLYGIAR